MPSTVKARLLLGWMPQHEALRTLHNCFFDEHLSDRKAVKLWRRYRDKVLALEPRNPCIDQILPPSAAERSATEKHIALIRGTPNGRYMPEVVKIHPGNLVVRQFHIVTERSEQYAQEMQDEERRINHCLGIGLKFEGPLIPRQVTPTLIVIDLPHFEFTIRPNGTGFNLIQWDRYITTVRIPGNRMVLWGGYHRAYALLRQLAGDAAGGAPLVTVMTGMPDVADFLAKPTFVRETVLGERPALLRDFLDEELFIEVNLRKRRAEARIEQIGHGRGRCGIHHVNDDT